MSQKSRKGIMSWSRFMVSLTPWSTLTWDLTSTWGSRSVTMKSQGLRSSRSTKLSSSSSSSCIGGSVCPHRTWSFTTVIRTWSRLLGLRRWSGLRRICTLTMFKMGTSLFWMRRFLWAESEPTQGKIKYIFNNFNCNVKLAIIILIGVAWAQA